VFFFDFDKLLLSIVGSIGGLFLLVKGYYASKSRDWRCDWEREVERRRPFGEIGSPFGRFTRQEGIFEQISGRPLLHASN
jgi:hypothetical protein